MCINQTGGTHQIVCIYYCTRCWVALAMSVYKFSLRSQFKEFRLCIFVEISSVYLFGSWHCLVQLLNSLTLNWIKFISNYLKSIKFIQRVLATSSPSNTCRMSSHLLLNSPTLLMGIWICDRWATIRQAKLTTPIALKWDSRKQVLLDWDNLVKLL